MDTAYELPAHGWGCNAVVSATENLRDEGLLGDWKTEGALIQETAAGYIEAGMSTCNC